MNFMRTTKNLRRALLASALLILSAGCAESTPDAEPPQNSAAANNPHVQAPQNAAAGASDAALDRALGIDVTLDTHAVRGRFDDAAVAFVFVRQPGTRMPLAVEHFKLADLPEVVRFSADESPGQVEVVLRISPTGKVERSEDDIETVALAELGDPPSQVTLVAGMASGVQTDTGLAAPAAAATRPAPAAPATRQAVAEGAVSIELSAATTEPLSDQLSVFVTAKAPNVPMPLAVKRLQLGDLPATIELSDADAMMPTHKLSTAPSFELNAHISRNGNARRVAGDWQGAGEQLDRNRYRIVIDEQVQ